MCCPLVSSSCGAQACVPARWRMKLQSGHCVERRNSGIEGGDDLGMGAYLVVVPVDDGPHGLPFERLACVFDRKRQFTTSPVDGAQRTEATGVSRPDRHGNVEPGESEASLTPAPLVGDKFAGTDKYSDGGIDACGLPADIPGRDRPESNVGS